MSAGVAFRDAVAADAEALSALARHTFEIAFAHLYTPENLCLALAGYAPESWRAEIADSAFGIRLAEADGEAVGYCKIGPPSLPGTPAGAIELRQLYLLDSAKGSGAADAMIAWAIEQARARGATAIHLNVLAENARARRFYERHGFADAGPYRFTIGTHSDEQIIMTRDIA